MHAVEAPADNCMLADAKTMADTHPGGRAAQNPRGGTRTRGTHALTAQRTHTRSAPAPPPRERSARDQTNGRTHKMQEMQAVTRAADEMSVHVYVRA